MADISKSLQLTPKTICMDKKHYRPEEKYVSAVPLNSVHVLYSALDCELNCGALNVQNLMDEGFQYHDIKGTVHTQIKSTTHYISLLACSAFYPSRFFWCALQKS